MYKKAPQFINKNVIIYGHHKFIEIYTRLDELII